ncbi:MAG: biotin/lipoyl-binding protein [Chloroflexi bacterium]|nr:biotin/lipoyl-binding protein [Chloroflexota bacterium]
MPKLSVTIDEQVYEIEATVFPQNESEFSVSVNGELLTVNIPDLEAPFAEQEWMVVNGRSYEITFHKNLDWIKAFGGLHRVEVRDMEALISRPLSGDGRIKAPIPGLITRVMVENGQAVEIGQPLLILEAMKMENEIRAPKTGVVKNLPVSEGQTVLREQVLAEVV